MKTLVIHPDDRSTDFLKLIYSNIPNKTVITGGVTKAEIRELIRKHDRVMMMGHGTPSGLLAVGQFKAEDQTPVWSNVAQRWFDPASPAFIIDHLAVAALKRKSNNVFIWCNADRFVEQYDLKGFYTGMFISEYGEAKYCGVEAVEGEVEYSNHLFAHLASELIQSPPKATHQLIKESYTSPYSKVIDYNNKRLYYKL